MSTETGETTATALIGQAVEAEFAGRPIAGVLEEIDHRHEAHSFEPEAVIARGTATVRVPLTTVEPS